jgi:hypothetical protein
MIRLLLPAVFSILSCGRIYAQPVPYSRETFINEIFNKVADSTLSRYYLITNAPRCSFKRFDYDEWTKYGLKEEVPIYVLNELSEKSYEDTVTGRWDQSKLQKAVCINDQEAAGILNPNHAARSDSALSPSKRRKIWLKQQKAWAGKSREEKLVFCFSSPEFTQDDQYAVVDVVVRCDNQACGMGTTYIFRREGDGWKVAGELLAWIN